MTDRIRILDTPNNRAALARARARNRRFGPVNWKALFLGIIAGFVVAIGYCGPLFAGEPGDVTSETTLEERVAELEKRLADTEGHLHGMYTRVDELVTSQAMIERQLGLVTMTSNVRQLIMRLRVVLLNVRPEELEAYGSSKIFTENLRRLDHARTNAREDFEFWLEGRSFVSKPVDNLPETCLTALENESAARDAFVDTIKRGEWPPKEDVLGTLLQAHNTFTRCRENHSRNSGDE